MRTLSDLLFLSPPDCTPYSAFPLVNALHPLTEPSSQEKEDTSMPRKNRRSSSRDPQPFERLLEQLRRQWQESQAKGSE